MDLELRRIPVRRSSAFGLVIKSPFVISLRTKEGINMVEEVRGNGQWYTARCERCREEFTGFYGVSSIIYNFAVEHEIRCFMKHCCLN